MEKDLNELYIELTHALMRVSRSYKTVADKVASQYNLSQATAWPAVMIHKMGDGIRPGEVAEALGLDPSSVVRVIDQLIEAKLLTRQEDANDRRARLLSLTPDGRKKVIEVTNGMIPFRKNLFSEIETEDLKTCINVLNALGKAIKDQESSC